MRRARAEIVRQPGCGDSAAEFAGLAWTGGAVGASDAESGVPHWTRVDGAGFDRGVSRKVNAGACANCLSAWEQVIELPESQFDAFTATYSSEPRLSRAGDVGEGRAATRDWIARTALTAAAHALGDGIVYWRESGKSLDESAGGSGDARRDCGGDDGGDGSRRGTRGRSSSGIRAGIKQARRNAKRVSATQRLKLLSSLRTRSPRSVYGGLPLSSSKREVVLSQ